MHERLKKAEELQAELLKQLGPWLDVAKGVKDQVHHRLAEKGIALRWPAVLGLVQDLAPQIPISVLSEVWQRAEPLNRWFKFELKQLGPETLELVTEPRSENLIKGLWDPLVFSAVGPRVAEFMVERHSPPGHLTLQLKKLEIEILTESGLPLHFRCYWPTHEVEPFLREINLTKEAELQLPVKVLSPDNVGIADIHLSYQVKLLPLIS